MCLLTAKPVLYAANVDEDGLGGNAFVAKVQEHAAAEGSQVVIVCAAMEAEIAVGAVISWPSSRSRAPIAGGGSGSAAT